MLEGWYVKFRRTWALSPVEPSVLPFPVDCDVDCNQGSLSEGVRTCGHRRKHARANGIFPSGISANFTKVNVLEFATSQCRERNKTIDSHYKSLFTDFPSDLSLATKVTAVNNITSPKSEPSIISWNVDVVIGPINYDISHSSNHTVTNIRTFLGKIANGPLTLRMVKRSCGST